MSQAASPATLPETVLQFGAGRFLRAFTDRFIHQANLASWIYISQHCFHFFVHLVIE